MRTLIIAKTDDKTPLQAYLKKRFPVSYVKTLFKKKGIRINELRGFPKDVLKSGDTLTFYVPFDTHKKTVSDFTKDILFEDGNIVVLHKKAGIAVHEGKTITMKDSLLGKLIDYYKEKNIRPFLVHRLDRDTSGCLLIVKNESLQKEYEQLFEEGQVDKEYMVLVKKIIREKKGTIDTPLPGRDKSLVNALTTYMVDKIFPVSNVSLVRVKIHTGRMHQIRLHFASIGHPVVMDDEHGDFGFNKKFRKTYKLKRQFLHACLLSFPYLNKVLSIKAPLPSDLAKVLEKL